MAYDWTFPGRAEMVRSALDVLLICSVIPRVQLQFCDRIDLQDDGKTVGVNIILSAAEGEIVQVATTLPTITRVFYSSHPILLLKTEDPGLETSKAWLSSSIIFGDQFFSPQEIF